MKKQIIVFILAAVCLPVTSLSQTKNASDWITSAYSKYDRQDWRGAIADYTKAIQLNPKYALSYYGRGLTRYKLKDYQGAITDYTKAIELKPNYTDAYKNRGISYLGLDIKSKAKEDFLKVKELGGRVTPKILDMCK